MMPSGLLVALVASVLPAVAFVLLAGLPGVGLPARAAAGALTVVPAAVWLVLARKGNTPAYRPQMGVDPPQRQDMVGALRDVSHAVLARIELDEVLQQIAGHGCVLLGADLVAIAVPASGESLRWAAVAGNRTDAWERPEFQPVAGLMKEAQVTGPSLLVSEAADRTPALQPSDAVYETEGLCTLVVVPLAHGDGLVEGALLAGYRVQREVSPAERLAAEVLADQAAIALRNARLVERLRQVERVRDEFLSRAAHELKTPVTSLRGFAQLTLRQLERNRLEPPDTGQLYRALRVIDEQSERLARLVSQLLDISRLTAGGFAIAPRPTDLVSILHSAVSAVQPMTSRHSLVLRAPPFVLVDGDPSRLEQVAVNLLDNAVKFSPNGGEILIEVGQPDAATVSFSVTDRGIGVPSEHRQRIFDRAHQAHSNQHFAGIGLGLYISREIVLLHGGQIVAELPEEGGTRLVVTLPVYTAAGQEQPEPAPAPATAAASSAVFQSARQQEPAEGSPAPPAS